MFHHQPHIGPRLPPYFALLQLSAAFSGRQQEQLCWKSVMEEEYGFLFDIVRQLNSFWFTHLWHWLPWFHARG